MRMAQHSFEQDYAGPCTYFSKFSTVSVLSGSAQLIERDQNRKWLQTSDVIRRAFLVLLIRDVRAYPMSHLLEFTREIWSRFKLSVTARF